jgi:hypothetical protein
LIAKAKPCGGDWTEGFEPPGRIEPGSHGNLVNSWRSESNGIGTGTEGWVKYLVGDNEALAYIHWVNPFIWSDSTTPIDFTVGLSDVTPPCDQDTGSQFPPGVGGSLFTYELFGAGISVNGQQLAHADWMLTLFEWPFIIGINLINTIIGQADIDIEITLGLRQHGSVRQTINSFYDGRKGLRFLATDVQVTSVRNLFKM